MDQRRSRWETHEDLLDYCRHSATPVGEMVLGVLGYRDPWRVAMSDATCIGLQLVNFWQDIARDLRDRDRIYLPREDMERFGVAEDDLRRPPAAEAGAAPGGVRGRSAPAAYLLEGEPLHRFVPRRVALDLRMFSAGGLALCDAIARQGHDTLRRRPAPGRARPGAHRRRRGAAGAAAGPVTLDEAYDACREHRPRGGAQLLLRVHPAAPGAPRRHLRGLRLQPPGRRQR